MEVANILEQLKKMQKELSELPPVPKRIEVTSKMYHMLRDYLLEAPNKSPLPPSLTNSFSGIQLWLQDDFSEWTDSEKSEGIKIIY